MLELGCRIIQITLIDIRITHVSRIVTQSSIKVSRSAQQCGFDWRRADDAKKFSLPSNAALIGAEQTVHNSAWNLPSNTVLIGAEQTVQKLKFRLCLSRAL